MLEAARRARADGTDLVIGVVDSHGRDDTAALAAGLPRLGAARGDALELDLDAALARKPAVIVVDELAHTNPAGSRHARRWQDVQELLDAGIGVWTALDVHHVESLGDVIEQILGVKVADTVP